MCTGKEVRSLIFDHTGVSSWQPTCMIVSGSCHDEEMKTDKQMEIGKGEQREGNKKEMKQREKRGKKEEGHKWRKREVLKEEQEQREAEIDIERQRVWDWQR